MRILIIVTLLLTLNRIECVRILGLFIHPAISHFRAFQPVLRGLADKGHNVFVVSHFSEKNRPANYHEFLLDDHVVLTGTAPVDEVYSPRNFYTYYEEFYALMDEGIASCESFFNSNHIKTLTDINKKQKFDILITEYFNTDCVLAFAYKLNITKFVGMSSCALMPWHYDRVGLPDTPSYIPNEFVGFSSRMSFSDRFVNWLVIHGTKLAYRYAQLADNARVRKYLGDGIPDVNELAKMTNLLFVNQHFSLSGVRPFPPSVIEIGGVHIKESKNSISDDIKSILDGAKNGVIYVSWGSIISPKGMPDDKKAEIVNAFKKLPQIILWKWENDSMTVTAENLVIRSWFPQIDILCHANVVAFMSHGGMMGVSEGVHCKKPMIVTPIYGDQYVNAAALEEQGVAVVLHYNELSEGRIIDSVNEVLSEDYKKNAEKVSHAYRNRLNSPLETAIYWIEYVAENDVGSLLKSQAVEMNFIAYHSYDVILLLILAFLSVFMALKFIFKRKFSENRRIENVSEKKKK